MVPLLPKDGRVDDHGEGIIPFHADNFQADLVLTHYDAWVFNPEQLKFPWVPWYPVDCEDVPVPIASRIQHAVMRITQTQHGVEATHRAGLDAEYVPAAFDKTQYHRRDRDEARGHLGATDKFLVACVAANTGRPGTPSRKSYPQMFEGFSMFLEHTPNAVLYIHAHQHGQMDLGQLAQQYGIENHIISALPYYLSTGAYTAEYMAGIYSAADVLLSPSMGEGFGVPIIEAQACGTPVITGGWTSMPEITRTGVALEKADAMPYPIVTYGTMYLPRPECNPRRADRVYDVEARPSRRRGACSGVRDRERRRRALAAHARDARIAAAEAGRTRLEPGCAAADEARRQAGGRRVKIGIILPTVAGREQVFDRVLAAYAATRPSGWEFDLIVPEGHATVGDAWNAGAEDVDADYVFYAIDDCEPHDGWAQVAVQTADAGYIPAPRLERPDGSLESCGSMGYGQLLSECADCTPCRNTGVIFVKQDWPLGRFLAIHFGADDDYCWRAAIHGHACVYRSGMVFTHHHETTGAMRVIGQAHEHHAVALEHAATLTLPGKAAAALRGPVMA